MITKQDLDEAIMECTGKRKPDANTCVKLAAFYTIRQNLFPNDNAEIDPMPKFEENYSYSNSNTNEIQFPSDSEFADAVNGRSIDEIMPIIDELMETIKVINPRLYNGVMRRLS